MAMLLIALPAGAYLIYQNESLKVQYGLDDLKSAHERLLEEERRLKVERAELASLARVESWARRERGLVITPGDAVFVLTRQASVSAPSLLAQAPLRTEDARRSRVQID
jgi:hypothetical protein